jgi:16S rRNA (uracil1498-N3)-methyltransferase
VPVSRVFVDRLPAEGESIRLTPEESAHARARRLKAGDRVVLFDGSGAEAVARATRFEHAGVEVFVERVAAAEPPAGSGISLYVAAVRLERLAWIAEKCTELGVSRLVLVAAERSQAFRAAAPVRARLERVARAAAKQCGAARWPPVSGPLPAEEVFGADDSQHRLLLDPSGAVFASELESAPAALAVGPEGGWTRSEIETAIARGWTLARLPAGLLRAETAAIAGLTLLSAALERGGRGATLV